MKSVLLAAACGLAVSAGALAAGETVTIVQKNRAFSERSVIVDPGDLIRFTNDDEFPHQIYVNAPGFAFDSDAQPAGATVAFAIPKPGDYRVLCGIHPRMRLDVAVRGASSR